MPTSKTSLVRWLLFCTLLGCRHASTRQTDAHRRIRPPAQVSADASVARVTDSGAHEAYPEAPEQHAPWTHPVGGSAALVSRAMSPLFDAGLADPRGCEYRELDLVVGDVWTGGGAAQRTHGWLLRASGGARRFAVAWSGVVYPVASLGPAADVAQDVELLVASFAPGASGGASHPGGASGRRLALTEAGQMRHDTTTWLKVPMMLRAGVPDELVSRYIAAMRPQTAADAGVSALETWWRTLIATEWAWALFDRGLCAHMRRDDAVAIHCLQKLSRARPVLDALIGEGDGVREFLSTAQELFHEQERRSRAPRRVFDLTRDRGITDPTARVAALIADLDEVSARQSGQPGGVDLGDDPVVLALVHEGRAAIEPLLEALERDDRLTRSVHFWRDFSRSRTVLGVHEAAYVALANLLETDFFAAASTGDNLTLHGRAGRLAVATRIRSFWERWRAVPLEQRWFDTLADDRESPAHWLTAAEEIVRPTSESVTRGSMVFVTTVHGSSPDGALALRGEGLRNRRSPSVSELLERRINHAIAHPPAESFRHWEDSACPLATALALWEPVGNRAQLSQHTTQIADALIARGREIEWSGACLTRLVVLEAEAGDLSALDTWSRWISGYRPTHLDDSSELQRWLSPLWLFPRRPSVASAVGALFGAPSGTFLPLDDLTNNTGYSYDRSGLIVTGLAGDPGFNRTVVSALHSPTVLATVVVNANGYSIEHDANHGWISSPDPVNIDRPAPGTREPFRRADYYAMKISEREGAPAFRAYWPLARRRSAIAAMEAYFTGLLRAP